MSRTITMVRNLNTGTFEAMKRGYSVPRTSRQMAYERSTAAAARRSGLLNNTFGKRGVAPSGTFGTFPTGKVWGEHWSLADPYKPDMRQYARQAQRLLGLTPMAKQFKLGKAALQFAWEAYQMAPPEWKEPVFATPPKGWTFDFDLQPLSRCGPITGLARGVHQNGGYPLASPCGLDLQVPTSLLSGNPFTITVPRFGGWQMYVGPTTVGDIRMTFDQGWSWPSNGNAPYPVRVTPSGPRPALSIPLVDPRAPFLPLRMLDPLTPPLVGFSPNPAPVPWRYAGLRGENGGVTPSTWYPRPFPGMTITPGGVSTSPPHVAAPPAYGDKEKKVRVPWKFMREFRFVQKKIFHPITEAGDFINAAFDATGCGDKTGVKTPQAKIQFVYDHFDCLDVGAFLTNLLVNHAEDKAVGGAMRELEKAHKRLGLPGSYKSYQPVLR